MQRAALMVRLKRLKFADRQAQLQVMVEREQSELMAMTDRAYRAVARQCVRQRLDKMRAVSCSRVYLATRNSFMEEVRCIVEANVESDNMSIHLVSGHST